MEYPHVRFRIDFGADNAVGPGKIALLEQIERSGSLTKAARNLGMSSRRAGLLLESLNSGFGRTRGRRSDDAYVAWEKPYSSLLGFGVKNPGGCDKTLWAFQGRHPEEKARAGAGCSSQRSQASTHCLDPGVVGPNARPAERSSTSRPEISARRERALK